MVRKTRSLRKRKNAAAREYAGDLRVLSEILSANEISFAGARNIATASFNLFDAPGDESLISFTETDIDLKIDTTRHAMPSSVLVEDRLLVDIIFKQKFLAPSATVDILGVVIENEINFRLRGKKGNRDLVAAWHFDRHSHPPDHNSPCHPSFHFQFGGRGLKEVRDKIDGVLILDTPRISSPPMDPILAVDVLLSHFNGPMWHTLRNENARYVKIVRQAQSRLWKPYFEKISHDLVPVRENDPVRTAGLLPNVL